MNKITNYLKENILNNKIDFTNVVISDTLFDESIELLENLNVVHQQPISNITKLPTEIKIITTLTPELGTFNVKCIGFTDSNNKLLAVVKIPEFTKEAGKGSYKFTTILSIDTENITINQTNEIFATREEVESLKQQISILQTQINNIVPPENLERFKILKLPSIDDYVLSIVKGFIKFLEYQINYHNENKKWFLPTSHDNQVNLLFNYLMGLDYVYVKSSDSDYQTLATASGIPLEELEKIKYKESTPLNDFYFVKELNRNNFYLYTQNSRGSWKEGVVKIYFSVDGIITLSPSTNFGDWNIFEKMLLTALGMSGVIQSDIVDNVVQNFPETTINVTGTTKLKVKEDLFKLQTPGVTPEATITFTMPETETVLRESRDE